MGVLSQISWGSVRVKFCLRCYHSSVIPTDLRITNKLRRKRENLIIKKAEKSLLNERIKQNNKILCDLKVNKDLLCNKLTGCLSPDLYRLAYNICINSYNREYRLVQERHIRKYNRIASSPWNNRNDSTTVNQSQSADRWIKNLSDRVLSEDEQSVLKKHINFAPSPRNIPVLDIVTAVEQGCSKLGDHDATEVRQEVVRNFKSSKPPKDNLSPGEGKAIKTLAQDDSIQILPADKGRCTVILNSEDYNRKVMSTPLINIFGKTMSKSRKTPEN